MSTFKCAECGVWVTLPYAKSIKTVRCHRCGTAYYCDEPGPPRKFYPALSMFPNNEVVGGPSSEWMPTHTRPVRPGLYDCRFRHIDPATIELWWDGRHFLTPDGKRVDMSQFLSWSGVYA
jgi:hypothetical protein